MRKQRFLMVLFLIFILMLAGCGSQVIEEDTKALEPDQATKDQNEQPSVQMPTEVTDETDQVIEEESEEEEIITEPEPEPEPDPGFQSSFNFEYPDAVRGIYVTGHSAGGSRFERLLDLIDSTSLNAMVIDIKDDYGHLTFRPEEDSPFYGNSKRYIKDVQGMLRTLEEHQIYPIARIVVFKDTVIANEKPEWSFKENGQVWKNGRGDSFVNPFLKEVWEYNVEIAKLAAEMGFREIQFDYVRFPEGFERRDRTLKYSMGDYEPVPITNEDGVVIGEDLVQPRVTAVTDFVAYAREELSEYSVDVSVDIFGYTATLKEAPGIGQNFTEISSHVDVISSMIYPSHWTAYFGISKPDTEPYLLVQAYAEMENEKLNQLEDRPTSRPWIQDFTASWLGKGNYIKYGAKEVEDQVRALNEAGIWEFLLWNAGNNYTPNVNYLPIGNKPSTSEESEAKSND